jgi:hypothetical protein
MAEHAHGDAVDFEQLLRRALTPVEPPEELAERLESTLVELTEAAADELESWELSAMRDPRNWVRPVAAATIGTAAGAGLVILRVRSQQKKRKAMSHNTIDFAEQTVRAIGAEVRKLIP